MIYKKAKVELIELENADVITTSNSCKPGKGIGDQNHCHVGPPGQTGEHPQGKW